VDTRRSLRACVGATFVATVLFASGCWPWSHHDKPPQQQYAEALTRGNSMQASQIWLNMSPEDRLKFARGEGISPQADEGDVKHQIAHHYEDRMNGAPTTAEDMEHQTDTPLGAALRQIPGASNPPPAPTQPNP